MKPNLVFSYMTRFVENSNHDDYKHIYIPKKEFGDGEIIVYGVSEGIELVFYDLDVKPENQSSAVKFKERFIGIEYCITGQYECLFKDNTYTIVSDRDVYLSTLNKKRVNSKHHNNRYKGVGVYVNVDVASKILSDVFGNKRLNLIHLYEYLHAANHTIVMKKPESIEAIFQALISADTEYLREYYYVKIMELLVLACELSNHDEDNISRYYTSINVDKAQSVRDYIHIHYAKRITIDQLVNHFCIPSATLRNLFKTRYNDTIYNYIKKVRMQNAKKMLVETDKKVVDIAHDIGYKNPSKFSTAFKDVTGTTPLKYRREYS